MLQVRIPAWNAKFEVTWEQLIIMATGHWSLGGVTFIYTWQHPWLGNPHFIFLIQWGMLMLPDATDEMTP